MKEIVEQTSRAINWDILPSLSAWLIEEGIRIQQIPAPTFYEQDRAAYIVQQFQAFGMSDIIIDKEHNAYGLVKGINRDIPALLISAHTDTVFDAGADLSIRRDGNYIFGPGLGDNSVGVAAMLAVAKWLYDKRIIPDCDIWFVATSAEEGLGDLKGIRAAYDRLKNRLGMVINLEGLAFGHIYHAGIAVHRMHITARADGGHSWLHFGRPSAVHGIMQLGAKIASLKPSVSPRTTFNIGMIEGGQTINSIATSAGLWLDLRSEDSKALDAIREQVQRLVKSFERSGLEFSIEVVGSRPAGTLDVNHPLVEAAMIALQQVKVRGLLETGSTDGNIPLSVGCPTVTIGITRGGNAHRLDEYIETSYVESGIRQLITLVMATSSYLHIENEKAAGD